MKSILRSFIVFASLLFAQSALAACGTGTGTCFWVAAGSSNNWSATGTSHWSATSGGAAGQTLAAGDAVVFDANSGTGTSNIDASISIASLDASASTAVTLTHGGVTLTVVGNLTFNSTIIYQGVNLARVVSVNPTGTNTSTITSAGQRFGALTINGATGATVTLADALRVDAGTGSSILTVTQGIFNDAGQSVTVGNFNSSNANTRTITQGVGNTWIVSGDDTSVSAWVLTTQTGLTLTRTLSISFTSSSGILKSMSAGSANTYNTVTFGALSNGTRWRINGSPTIATLNLTAPNFLVLQESQTFTITNAFAWTGTSANNILVQSGSAGTAATITTGSGTTNTAAWTGFQSITFTPVGGSTLSATNSMNYGGNTGTGFTITAPVVGGGGGRIIGG